MHPEIPFIREIMIFLVAAGVLVPIAARFKISPLIGFLLMGIVVGPFGLGLLADVLPALQPFVLTDVDGVRALAELGVIFLLFMIGLELSITRLGTMKRLVFGFGGVQIVLSAIVIGTIAYLFGNSIQAAIVLGLCFALSSTAVVMTLLVEQKRLSSKVGRASFGILLMQDLAVVPILFIVGFMGLQASDASAATQLFTALATACVVITLVLFLGRKVLRPLLHLVVQTHSRELFMAATLLIVIGISALFAKAGLSMALGAFLAGLILAETEFKHQIEIDIEPFKGLLLGLFFMSVGMGIDLREIAQNPFWIPASVIGLFVIKACIIFALARAQSYSNGRAFELGLLLGQGGEFAFVVVALALKGNLIPHETAQFMLIVASLSMVLTPFVVKLGAKGRGFLDRGEKSTAAASAPYAPANNVSGHVLIAGYGRFGRMVGEVLQGLAIPFQAFDTNAAVVGKAYQVGLPVYFGDSVRLETLRKSGVANAAALVVTLNDPAKVEAIVREVHAHWPQLPILARARDEVQAARLYALGASHTVPETIEASLDLSEALLQHLGYGQDQARGIADQRRKAVVASIEEALQGRGDGAITAVR